MNSASVMTAESQMKDLFSQWTHSVMHRCKSDILWWNNFSTV